MRIIKQLKRYYVNKLLQYLRLVVRNFFEEVHVRYAAETG